MMENIFDTAVIVEGNKEILSFVVKELAGTEYIIDDIFFPVYSIHTQQFTCR